MPERLEMARESIAALNRRDVETVVGAFASDAEWWPLRSSTEGPFRGHDGIRAWFADTAEMFEHLHAEVDEVHERDDVVVAFGRLEAKGARERHDRRARHLLGVPVRGRQGDPGEVVRGPRRGHRGVRVRTASLMLCQMTGPYATMRPWTGPPNAF